MKQIKIAVIISIASLACMSFSAIKKSPAASPVYNMAKVSWAKESHDFGEITKSKPVSVEFAFTNTGVEPLLVTGIIAGCGCTTYNYTREPIMPGKSSAIKVMYDAATAGAFTKTVTVNFQDAGLKKILTIKGTVK